MKQMGQSPSMGFRTVFSETAPPWLSAELRLVVGNDGAFANISRSSFTTLDLVTRSTLSIGLLTLPDHWVCRTYGREKRELIFQVRGRLQDIMEYLANDVMSMNIIEKSAALRGRGPTHVNNMFTKVPFQRIRAVAVWSLRHLHGVYIPSAPCNFEGLLGRFLSAVLASIENT